MTVSRSEAALRESEERFRAAFEQAAIGIAIARLDGRWLRANQRFCEIIGYTHDELQTLGFQDITHADDLDKNLSLQRRLLAHEIPNYSIEKRLRRKNGAYVWVNVIVSLVRTASGEPGYTVAIFQDVTERKADEVALRESEERFRAMFEQAAVGISVADREGRWVRVNQRLGDLVGYSVEELQAMRFQDLTHPDDLDVSLRRRRTMFEDAGPAYSLEKRYLHKNGSIVWVSLTTSMMRSVAGAPSFSIAIIQDITKRKQLEQELHHAQRWKASASSRGGSRTISTTC